MKQTKRKYTCLKCTEHDRFFKGRGQYIICIHCGYIMPIPKEEKL